MYINFNYNKILFLMIMILSSIFSISSLSFINLWMGMEINLMAFIPLMMNLNNNLTSESMMKYFLVQSLSSVNFLFASIMLIMFLNWYQKMKFLNIFILSILNLSLLMKMGAAPFHFWFPKIMKSLNWMNCLILSTWQKIIPMISISYCFIFKLIIIFSLASTIMGSIMGLNQISLQIIFAYSSISHIGWMLMAILLNMNFWNYYFLIYTLMNFTLMYFFKMNKFFNLKQIFSSKNFNSMNFFIFLNFLSLGGLPPFLGFLPKLMMIELMIENKFIFMTFMFVMFSLINLFFYLRLSYSFFLMNFYEMKFSHNQNKNNFFLNMLNFISLFGLILIYLMNYFM
uniref:NADH dehydrogenase subunit 2 n=1 Tax=Goera fissa TaxID=1875398 RepID=UPI0022DCE1B7|nr:NADH dehydrogenase subunit 2 [Goera fissa]UZZ43948.1 NADH dehydrogenase subunit 2 [Goera fissa]